MAALVYILRTDMLRAVERRGVLVSMDTKARVMFQGIEIPSDYTVLSRALDQAGVPKPVTGIEEHPPLDPPYQNLVLVERAPELALDDTSIVDVTLKYEHILEGPNQIIRNPIRGILYAKGQCSIAQKPTNFYKVSVVRPSEGSVTVSDGFFITVILDIINNGFTPGLSVLVTSDVGTFEGVISNLLGGQVEINLAVADAIFVGSRVVIEANDDSTLVRQQMMVAHSYPLYDPDIAGLTIFPGFPHTQFQTGEINVPFPQANLQFEGLLRISTPWAIANKIIARINSDWWSQGAPETWICSDVKWNVHDIGGGVFATGDEAPIYHFSFEFQNNIDGWNPLVVFNDQRSGRPPALVLPATHRDQNGVLNQAINPYSDPLSPRLQPAGYWKPPVLQKANFNNFFRSVFEGDRSVGID